MSKSKKNFFDEKRIMLVIAHPDDEAMFFGPTLIAVRDSSLLSVICLSTGPLRFHFLNNVFLQIFINILITGNADGLGSTRRQELLNSADFFGIDRSLVHVIDHEGLQDGMDRVWSPATISRIVTERAITFRPDMVIINQINYIISFYVNDIFL